MPLDGPDLGEERRWSPGRILLAGYMLGVGSVWTLLALMRLRRPAARSESAAWAAPVGWRPPAPRKPAADPGPRPTGPGGAIVGASPAAIREGYEPLSTNTRALGFTLAASIVALAGILGGLWLLLGHYMADDPPDEAVASVAPALPRSVSAPLEPKPGHDDLDWQDLVHLRQREDARFRGLGWSIDPVTGEAVVPMMATSAPSLGDPLRFPPTLAPVRAGPYASLPRANVFPPVGAAAKAEQQRPSQYRPPTGLPDVKDLPEQSGPPGRQNDPRSVPATSPAR